MQRSIGDFISLFQRADVDVVRGCATDLDVVKHFMTQNKSTPLGVHDLRLIWTIIPILLGNPPECDADLANQLASPWINGDRLLSEALVGIGECHSLGGSMLLQDADGVWVSEGLFGWIKKIPVPVLKRRWALIPDYPVPVRQVLLQTRAILHVLGRGDIRPIIVGDTLADLRLNCASSAKSWGHPGQTLADILAIGGFDASAASSLLLHRGDNPLDGWNEVRLYLGLPLIPGWTGAIIELYGSPADIVARLHPARYAWLSKRFEATASPR